MKNKTKNKTSDEFVKEMKKNLKSPVFKKLARWQKRSEKRWKKEGLKTDFGKGLVVCLAKFAEHIDNDFFQIPYHLDFFYHKLKGDCKKLKQYDIKIQNNVDFYSKMLRIYKTPEKLISSEIELWANGASDHLYDIEVPKGWEKTIIGIKVQELKSLGLEIGHGFNVYGKIWTVNHAEKLRKLVLEISYLVDKKLGLKPDKGKW